MSVVEAREDGDVASAALLPLAETGEEEEERTGRSGRQKRLVVYHVTDGAREGEGRWR